MREKDKRTLTAAELAVGSIAAAFERPTEEDLRTAPIADLLSRWYMNHDTLMKTLAAGFFPCCSMHGSSQEGLKLIAAGERPNLEVAVVPDQGGASEKLFKFYHAASYVSTYAFRLGKPGSILVHHFKAGNPQPIDLWEQLLPGSIGSNFWLHSDTKEVQDGFNAVTLERNLGWRAGLWVANPNFPKLIERCDEIAFESLGPLYQKVACGLDCDDESRFVLARRFYLQELVRRIFEPS